MTTELSSRELEIVMEAAAGLTDKEIAKRLDLSIASVRTYWERLRRKLDATNRGHAIALALRTLVMEQRTKETERMALIQLIVENTTDYAIFALDLKGKMTSWNIGVQRVFGYSEEEFLELRSDLIFTPEDRKNGEADKEMLQAMEDGRSEDERWHLRKDGTRFYGSGVMLSLRDDDGNLRGLGKIVRDYTDVKQILDRVVGKGITL
jgi:PAS domain S-box-containing protein